MIVWSDAGARTKADTLFRLRSAGERVPALFLVVGETDEVELSTAVVELGGARFAVRSSSDVEDAAQQSYAGHFSTFLDVAPGDVGARVSDVMLSGGAGMSVIVQAMVPAGDDVLSGVLFTANPQGILNEVVVSVAAGLASVTDGIAPVATSYCHVADGLVYTETQEGAPVLPPGSLAEAVAVAERVRSELGYEADVEFALVDGVLWVLQARPITTLAATGTTTLDNANIVESYPGLSLPLTVSFVRAAYHGVFRGLGVRILGSEDVVDRFDDVLQHMTQSCNGRIYYRIDNWYTELQFLPFAQRLIPVWQDMMGVGNRDYVSIRHEIPLWLRLTSGFRIVREFVRVPEEMSCLERTFADAQRRFWTDLGSARTTADLEGLYRDIERRLLAAWDVTLLNDLHAFFWTAALRRLAGAERANAALAGVADVESMRPVRAMAELASRVGEPGHAERSAAYIDEFGDRYLAELKLESPTFRTHPELLEATVAEYAGRLPAGVAEASAGRAGTRADGGRPRRDESSPAVDRLNPVARWVRAKAVAGIRNREVSRLNRSRVYGMVREVFRRVGGNLMTEGRVAAAEDVFWLTVEEAFDTSAAPVRPGREGGSEASVEHGEASGGAAYVELVAERQRRYGGFSQLPAYSRLVFAGEPFDKVVLGGTVKVTDDPSAAFRGTPTSPGVVRGRVRVVASAADVREVNGEILVTTMTDPGWVFLLTHAGGVIAEQGSLLSHTAIISRELGKPMVVGVRHATRVLKDGDEVVLDGSTGEITRVGTEASGRMGP